MSEFVRREICEGVECLNIRDDRFKAGSRYIEGGAPILKRGSKIPKADCVVVADLKNADILVPKLKQMTNKPVYTAEEFAGFFKKL